MKPGKPIVIYPLFWMTLLAGAGILAGREWVQDFRWLFGLSVLFLSGGLLLKSWKSSLSLFLAVFTVFQFYTQVRDHALPEHHLLSLVGGKRQSAEIRLKVLDLPMLKTNDRGEPRIEFTGEVLELKDWEGARKATGKIRVVIRKPGDLSPIPGEVWLVRGFLDQPGQPRNPGEFDYGAYLANKRIFYQLRSEGAESHLLEPGGDFLGKTSFHLRQHMLKVLKLGLEDDPQISSLMAGMLFGYKEGISEELEQSFRVTGTLHLFAVSGQNVGLVLTIFLVALQSTGVIRWRWGWTLLPLLLIFCLATGMQSSAARAFVMAGLMLSAWAIYRPVNIFNVLSGAALILWVWDPAEFFDVGFQLSFLVVLGMALGTERLLDFFYQWGKPDPWIPRRLIPGWRMTVDRSYWAFCGVVSTSICAWIASQSLILAYFNLFSVVTLVANVAVMPLAGLILTVSALSVAASLAGPALPVILNQVNWLALKLMVLIIEFLAALPGGYSYVAAPWIKPPENELRVTIFQSRQASPMFIQYGGQNWILDSGSVYTWESALDRFRQQQGVNHLEGLVLTQAGGDHMGGAGKLISSLPVSFCAEAGFRSKSGVFHQWLREMEEGRHPKQFWRKGDSFRLGREAWLEVLWPRGERFSDRQEDQGLVLRLIKDDKVLIYAGDIPASVEKELLDTGLDLRAEILIQGEHSREANLGEDWIRAVSPRWLVRPERGFQPDRSLTWQKSAFLEEVGIRILRMEDTGALQFRIGQEGNADLCFWSSQKRTFTNPK